MHQKGSEDTDRRATISDLSNGPFVSLTGALVRYRATIKCIDTATSP